MLISTANYANNTDSLRAVSVFSP